MAEVLLVQPKVGEWDDFRSHPSLPLALLSASRFVAKEFDTFLIDTRLETNWKEKIKAEIKKGPICAGITSMTGRQIGYALEISSYIKSISEVPIVWGGIHASLLPEATLKNKNIDILVIGEGELSFLELVKALKDKRNLRDIEGIWYKSKEEIMRNHERRLLRLDDLPDLPISLVNLSNYLPLFKGRRTFYIETSRGCPNSCKFCYNTIYHKNTWRAFSAERVIKEIKYLKRNFKINSFYIIDDNFFIDLERARDIALGIIAEKLDILWEIQGITVNSALKMDRDYLNLLIRSGMTKVHFGIESASEKILKQVNKKLNINDVIKLNRDWSKYNIIIQYNFMCGFPGESIDDIRKTKDLIFQLMKENPNALISPICPYTPYPGTLLYDEAVKDGFIQNKKLEDWQDTDYGDNLWQSPARAKLLPSLFFVSMFLDKHRAKDMVRSKIIKFIIGFYRPIAKFRLKHLFLKFMIELKIKNLFIALTRKLLRDKKRCHYYQ